MKIMIVTGGNCNLQFLKKSYIDYKPDYVIGADRGLMYLKESEIIPDLCIGDFDSLPKEYICFFENKENTIRLKPEKDFTDTHVAFEKAIAMKPEEIVIFGATGTRLDHTLANISILKMACDAGIDAKIIDENNIIRVINKQIAVKKRDGIKYVSVMPLGDKVEELSMRGFKYETEKITLTQGISLGISNEIAADEAEILFKEGYLIVMETRD